MEVEFCIKFVADVVCCHTSSDIVLVHLKKCSRYRYAIVLSRIYIWITEIKKILHFTHGKKMQGSLNMMSVIDIQSFESYLKIIRHRRWPFSWIKNVSVQSVIFVIETYMLIIRTYITCISCSNL